jgi:hypothetical protein
MFYHTLYNTFSYTPWWEGGLETWQGTWQCKYLAIVLGVIWLCLASRFEDTSNGAVASIDVSLGVE